MLHFILLSGLPMIQKQATMSITLLICGILIFSFADKALAEQQSKRVEVYSLSQNYWDTQYGDTLGEIVIRLLPNNPSKREALKQDIVRLNPDAFINNNPARLLANKRLWLPVYMKQPDTQVDPFTTIVESYSWGNIKRPKQ